MYHKKPVIDSQTYLEDMLELCNQIKNEKFDCIICLKRSGFMLGAFLSNQLTLPLFTASEIKSIPVNFKSILVVDDKICTGKSLNKTVNKLPLLLKIKTACMYVESEKLPNFYVRKLNQIHRMWYEKE